MTAGASVPTESHAIVLGEVVAMGGAERSCFALARWLYERGLPVHFVTYQDKVGLASFASHPLEVVQLNPVMDARHKISALKEYFAQRPGAPQPLMSGYQPSLHGSLASLRGFHCLMHDTPSLFSDANERGSLKRRLSRWVSDRAVARGLQSGGKTIVTSEYLKAETQRVFHVEAAIARMGGMVEEGAFHLRPVSGQLRMLSVSRIEDNKRIDWMVRALATMEKQPTPLSQRTDWRLDITGKGSQLEAMRSLAQELGVADRILFHGFVSDEQLLELYDRANLFLMPAVQGYGIPAIEALSRGIPVMLHRESGVSDILMQTPWATVMHGGEEAMVPVLESAIDKTVAGVQLSAPPPEIPTEASWAAEVARLCRWV